MTSLEENQQTVLAFFNAIQAQGSWWYAVPFDEDKESSLAIYKGLTIYQLVKVLVGLGWATILTGGKKCNKRKVEMFINQDQLHDYLTPDNALVSGNQQCKCAPNRYEKRGGLVSKRS
jgi:hypothetical protein